MNHLLSEVLPFVSNYGLWIVFFGMMVEGTTMILVSGVLCYLGMLSLGEVVPVAIAGAVIGDQFWYLMGKYYARSLLVKFTTLKERVEKLEESVINKGRWLAFGGRFVYGGAILFPLTLGVYKFSHKTFTLFDTIGVTLWSIVGILLGYFLGSGVEEFVGKIEKVWHFVLLIALFIAVVYLVKYAIKYFKSS